MRCLRCKEVKEAEFVGQRVCKECTGKNARERVTVKRSVGIKHQTKPKRSNHGSQY